MAIIGAPAIARRPTDRPRLGARARTASRLGAREWSIERARGERASASAPRDRRDARARRRRARDGGAANRRHARARPRRAVADAGASVSVEDVGRDAREGENDGVRDAERGVRDARDVAREGGTEREGVQTRGVATSRGGRNPSARDDGVGVGARWRIERAGFHRHARDRAKSLIRAHVDVDVDVEDARRRRRLEARFSDKDANASHRRAAGDR